MHRVGVWPPDELTAFVGRRARSRARPGGAVDPSRERRRTTPSRRRISSTRSRRAVDGGAGGRPRAAAAPRREQRRFDPAPGSPARPGAHRASAIYGIEPAPGVGAELGLRPALTWRSTVTMAKRLTAGERVSLRASLRARARRVGRHGAGGLRRRLPSRAVVPRRRPDRRPTVPGGGERDDGPADGRLRRHAPSGGRRRRAARRPGRRGRHRERARGRSPGTIAYEIVTRIGARVPRATWERVVTRSAPR